MSKSSSSDGNNRQILDLADVGLPEVPLIGINNQTRARKGLSEHLHEGAMEICYLVKGELVFRTGDQDYRMKGGSIFWTHGHEVHGSGHNPYGRGLLYWMQLRIPRRAKRFLTLAPSDAAPLTKALRNMPRRLFQGQPAMKELFEETFRICLEPEELMVRLAIASRLVEWLRLVVESAALCDDKEIDGDVRQVIRFIDEHVDENFSVLDLAHQARLSESRFKAKFREQVGVPPGEYVLRRKVECAEKMLRTGECNITDVAFELGFSSSQYFATVFKRYTHRRPSDLLKG